MDYIHTRSERIWGDFVFFGFPKLYSGFRSVPASVFSYEQRTGWLAAGLMTLRFFFFRLELSGLETARSYTHTRTRTHLPPAWKG